jgi:mRNA interferase MazF
VVRGDVHQIKLPGERGHVQESNRFAVIVQADDLLALSTVVVCPTSRSVFPPSFHPEISVLEPQRKFSAR